METAVRPAYLRIADDLRAAIRDGTYGPGDRLPTAAELRDRYGVSDIVARHAVGVLSHEGLVETRTRAGTIVRDRPPVRRIAGDRYRVEVESQQAATSFTADQRIGWQEYRLDRRFAVVDADERLAALFEVEPGEPVLERRFVFYARGEPSQMSRSCLLMSDVDGTPVADPANEPWPGGNTAQLRTLGIVVTAVEESVSARMPTPEEADTLHMAKGVPVLCVTRRTLADRRVVEVAADIVIPADRAMLDYRIDL